MKDAFLILHLVFAILLIGLVMLQSSHGGLSSSFSSGTLYRSKRGAERVVFTATIIIAVLFFCTSIVTLLVQ